MEKDLDQEFPPEMVEGVLLPPHPFRVPMATHVQDLRSLALRPDDIFLVGYPKAGTHWNWEVISMLLRGNTKYETRTKEFMMMEFSTKDKLDAEPSPRIFNTHLPFFMLNVAEIKEKKIKVVHVYRNPKDTVVSQFYHFRQFITSAVLDDFLQKFVDGSHAYGSYAGFLKQVEKFEQESPDVDFFNLSYEEARRSPVETVERLARFLGVTATPDLCAEVAEACSFGKMKAADKNKEVLEGAFSLKQDIYRKGQVGDWKNHLTVRNNKLMDAYVADNLCQLSHFKMEFTP